MSHNDSQQTPNSANAAQEAGQEARKTPKLSDLDPRLKLFGNAPLDWADRFIHKQSPLARGAVERMRKKYPHDTPAQLVKRCDDVFRNSITASGALIGGAAAVPGLGTVSAVALTAGEMMTYAEACGFYTLCLGNIYGVNLEDQEKRRTLLLSIMLGDAGEAIVQNMVRKQGQDLSDLVGGRVPPVVMKAINKRLARWITRRSASKAGALWLGRLIPFGIGAVIGGVGNRSMAKGVIETAHHVFGPAPVPGQAS